MCLIKSYLKQGKILTHKFLFEIWELVVVKPSLANSQKLPAQNLWKVRPFEGGLGLKQ